MLNAHDFPISISVMTAVSTKKIGIFPAAGGLGGSTIKHILPLVKANNLVLISRKPETLAEYSRLGAEVRRADYEEDASLKRVFDGVGVLFLISYASFEHEYRSLLHRKAIDEACRSGVKHVFYSSLAFAGNLSKTTAATVMKAHLDTEKYLEELGRTRAPDFTYTILREGLYHESFPMYTSFFDPRNMASIDTITDGRNDDDQIEIKIPHNGSGPGVAWVKRDELGEASALLISKYAHNPLGFPFINSTLLLSGPKVLSLQDTVEILGRLIGKRVQIKEVSIDEYAKQPHVAPCLTYHGVNMSREWASAWEAIRNGECAVVTPVLKETLGRVPEDFEVTMRKALTADA